MGATPRSSTSTRRSTRPSCPRCCTEAGPRQQTLRTEGPVYRAVVLMELPIGEMSKKLMDQIRAQEQLYTRFRASEAFKELDAEVKRYEAWKREQGIPR